MKTTQYKKITPFSNPIQVRAWDNEYRSAFYRTVNGKEQIVILPIDPSIPLNGRTSKEFQMPFEENKYGLIQMVWDSEAKKMSYITHPYEDFIPKKVVPKHIELANQNVLFEERIHKGLTDE